jgi:hypothetical protein
MLIGDSARPRGRRSFRAPRREIHRVLAAAAALLVVAVLVVTVSRRWTFSGGAGAIPWCAVGAETVALLKIDLSCLAGTDGHEGTGRLLDALGPAAAANAISRGKLEKALSYQGVTQVAVPLNVGPSTLQNIGLYLPSLCSSPVTSTPAKISATS